MLTYRKYDKYVEITGCDKSAVNVEIPFEIERLTVKSITPDTFSECSDLKSIKISNPNCKIYDNGNSIPQTAIIYGYKNSTAQTYADKYNRQFVTLTDLTGDVNGDGAVNSIDASLVMKNYVISSTKDGVPIFTEQQEKLGNVNGDISANAVDASLIMGYYTFISTPSNEFISMEEFVRRRK